MPANWLSGIEHGERPAWASKASADLECFNGNPYGSRRRIREVFMKLINVVRSYQRWREDG